MTELVKVDKFPYSGRPNPGPDECASDETPQVLSGVPANGDLVRITDGTDVQYLRHTVIPAYSPPAKTLTKTGFLDHAETELGSVDRVIEVLEGARDSSTKSVRYAYQRYEAATLFDKTKATGFFDGLQTASILTESERNKLVTNWPTA